jgi:hypothetical protein
VRDFLQHEFGDRDHLFAFHDDTAHYHAHVVVGLQSRADHWLNPRREHLRAWRQHFAQALERHGIEASATPSYSRGQGKQGYRRDLDELTRRSTRQRPDGSPTYDAEIEHNAIQKRADAWTRIAEHYAAAGDHEAAQTIRDYVADHYDQHQLPKAPKERRASEGWER